MLSNIYKYIPIWFGGTAYKRFKSRITNYTCQRGNPYLGRDKNRFLVDGFIDVTVRCRPSYATCVCVCEGGEDCVLSQSFPLDARTTPGLRNLGGAPDS